MDFNLDFFDALRRMKARREQTAPAKAVELPPQPLPAGEGLHVSTAGLVLIKRFEGCAKRRSDGRFEAYPDPGTGGAPWTIGWGA
ncbi:MAG: lysozyme, partial [Novosphingobium sp.]